MRFTQAGDQHSESLLDAEVQRLVHVSNGASHAVYATPVSFRDSDSAPSGQASGAAADDDPAKSFHWTRFYDDDKLLVSEVVRYLGTALRTGHTAIMIARPAFRQQVASELQSRQAHRLGTRHGTLIALDAHETLAKFMVKDWPHEGMFNHFVGKLVERSSSGGKAVAAYGEMVALLCEDGNFEAAVRLEKLWNALLARRRFSLFCGYPAQLFTSPAGRAWYPHLCAAHQEVLTA